MLYRTLFCVQNQYNEEEQIFLDTSGSDFGDSFFWHLWGNLPLLKSMVSPLVFFYAGMFCYVYREYIILKWQYACICIILLLIASKLHILTYGLYVLFPYILLVFWYNCRPVTRISVLGNYSYGMYLWAYPIQQTFILASGNKMSPISNIILSLLMAIIMGMVTFYAIEKPMDVRSIKH